MVRFFESRSAARSFPAGRMVDNGPNAPEGQRYGRAFPGIGGNGKQRRKAIRAIMRSV